MEIHRPALQLELNFKLFLLLTRITQRRAMIKFSQTSYLKVVLTKHGTDLARCERVKRQFG